jgi:biopolymer transport protein ExbD
MALTSAAQDDVVMAEINITPFTDVLLVLLIIFMILASLAAPPGFQKNLPDSNDNTPIKNLKNNNINVEVSDKGGIFIDGRRTTEQNVYADLGAEIAKRGKIHIALAADAKAPYSIIVRVLDAARQAGVEDVGFVTS